MSEVTAQMVPLDLIDENEAALRSVDRTGEQFLQLVDSIRSVGVLNSITVSPLPDTEPQRYCLIDGLQRYSASCDAGLKTIPALVKTISEADAHFAQIIANVHRVDTKPAEFASSLVRILSGNPTMTMTELAASLSKTPGWLNGMLKLNKLADEVKPLVDAGKITLTNAQALAKLPAAEQMEYLEAAQTESPNEFVPKVTERARAIRAAAREGRKPGPAEFAPIEHLRKPAEIKALRADPTPIIAAAAAAGAEDVLAFALDYLLQMDPASIEAQKAKDEERKEKKKADNEAKSVVAKARRAEAAKEEAETARAEYDEKKKAEEAAK